MKFFAIIAALAGSLARCGLAKDAAMSSSSSAVTPIQKVLELMENMLKEGTAAKKEEEVKFAKFAQWCKDQTRVKKNEIAKADAEVESLTASIEQNAATIRALGERIAEVDEDVGRWAKDQKSASEVRGKEKVDFDATVADYSETLFAITKAIEVLKKQSHDRPQAELVQSLIQVRNFKRIPLKAKAALTAFLQEAQPGEEYLLREGPQAYGYEFQSTGVIEMLERLKDEFSKKKMELEEEELKAQQAFTLMMQQLTDNTENGNHELGRKQAAQAEEKQLKAENEGTLAQVTSDRTEDQTYLDDMTGLCELKHNDFESRQALRAEELESLQKAIEIISSKTVKGAGEDYLPQLMQIRAQHRGSVLAQLRAQAMSPVQEQLVIRLQERAKRIGSTLLSQVAMQIASDPFGKVKKLIKELISKLQQEAASEAEHKGWCDSELAANKVNREARTVEVQELEEKIDDLTADIAQLTQDIATLSEEIAELEEAMAETTKDREETKAKNLKTIADAKEAQVAVQEAIAVLKEYYAKSVEATAFAQQTPAEDAPETFDKPYKGMFPEGGNIIDFLEVILTDFSRLESQTSADEAQEQEEYEKFMFESKKDKALKENEKEHKESTKTDKESALHTAKEDLKMTQAQLDKAIEYYDKLKPSCVDSGITYEERVRRREEEIVSLEEALKILSGDDI